MALGEQTNCLGLLGSPTLHLHTLVYWAHRRAPAIPLACYCCLLLLLAAAKGRPIHKNATIRWPMKTFAKICNNVVHDIK